MHKPREVYDCEQKIAEFFFGFFGILFGQRVPNLGHFFTQFFEYAVGVVPVKTRAGRLARQLQALQHGG